MLILILEILALALAHILAWIAAAHALLTKHDPRSGLGWTIVLIFLPVIGLALYLIFGIGRSQSRAERIMRRLDSITRRYSLSQSAETGQNQDPLKYFNNIILPAAPGQKSARIPNHINMEARRLAILGFNLTSQPLCGGNSIQPLRNGDQAYPAMLEAINRAKNHVFLSTYIFNYGIAAKAFIKALENAHKRGADVRVLVDGIGALYSWRKPWKILARKGVKTTLFRPPKLFPPNFGINLRSHRKVMICDDTAFTGGMNISDGNLLLLRGKRRHIQDMHFLCKGPVVSQLRKAFLLNWSFCTDEFFALPPTLENAAGKSSCRAIMDGPGNDSDALNDLICGAINISRNSVRIMTPYFLPTHDLMASLRSAAQRGVDVRVILPGKNNLAYMRWATERLLPNLLSSGVRVWYQAPPFAHTKLLAVDGFYSLVGSANLDARSLRLNFELNLEIYDIALHDSLARFMDSVIEKGWEITGRYLDNQSLPVKLRNAASWVFSPYL